VWGGEARSCVLTQTDLMLGVQISSECVCDPCSGL